MIKKRGFTLLELLAVMVLLAIIALIATPQIFGFIKKGDRRAFRQSVDNILRSANEYRLLEMKSRKEKCVYFSFDADVEVETERNGKMYIPVRELDLDGKLPTQGEIEVCKKYITATVSDGNTTVDIDSEGNDTIIDGDMEDNKISRPTIEQFNFSATKNSITVLIKATDNLNSIVKYHFYLNGKLVSAQDTESYTFSELKENTPYKIRVEVENEKGFKTSSEKIISTKGLQKPVITVTPTGWANNKTVKIDYNGIEGYKYEYQIITGTTKEGVANGVWHVATNPQTLHFVSNGSVEARISDNEGNSLVSSYTISQIDNTEPTINLSVSTSATSATLVASCNDDESSITKIEFSRDGAMWDNNGTNEVKVYGGLKTGSYTFYARCTNSVGLQASSSKVGNISPLARPVMTIDKTGWQKEKILTINYPGSGKYEFIAEGTFTIVEGSATNNNGTYTTSDSTIKLKFTTPGAVTAIASNDNERLQADYTITEVDGIIPVITVIADPIIQGSNGWYTSVNITSRIATQGESGATLYTCTTTSAQCDPIASGKVVPSGSVHVLGDNATSQKVCSQAINGVGVKSSITCSTSYKVDTKAPSITTTGTSAVTIGEDKQTSSFFNVTWGVSGTGTISCTPASTGSLGLGSHKVTCIATGKNGKMAELSKNVVVRGEGTSIAKLQVGDWVNYHPTYDKWNTAHDMVYNGKLGGATNSSTQYLFGILDTAHEETSKQGSIECSGKPNYSGWRVMSISDGVVTLIHGGIPECFQYGYHDTTDPIYYYATETNFNTKMAEAWNKYGNATYATSARYMTGLDFDTIAGKKVFSVYNNAGGCLNYGSNYGTCLSKISATSKDTSLIKIGNDYWLHSIESCYSPNSGPNYCYFYFYSDDNTSSGHTENRGVRPVIVLKKDLMYDVGSGVQADPYQIMEPVPEELASKVKKGDYVNYNPTKPVWNTSTDGVKTGNITSQGQFSIYGWYKLLGRKNATFYNGSSRSYGYNTDYSASTPSNKLASINYDGVDAKVAGKHDYGWQVLDVYDDVVTLVHAGTPEAYYHGTDAVGSVATLTNSTTEGIAWKKYGNANYATSARYMTIDDLATATGKQDPFNDCDDGTCATIDMVSLGQNYYLASQRGATGNMYMWQGETGRVGNASNKAYGVRPVIVLKAGIQTNEGTGTLEDPYNLIAN